MRRMPPVLGGLVVAAVLAGCGGSNTGTVVGGIVYRGRSYSPGYQPGLVQVVQRGHVVAHAQMQRGERFHFRLAPGSYMLLTSRACRQMVRVQAGRISRADVTCVFHGSGMVGDARVFGTGRSCGGPANICGGIAGTVFARDARSRVVATRRLVKSRYSFLLAPGRYTLVLRFEKGGSLTKTIVVRAHQSTKSDFSIGFP